MSEKPQTLPEPSGLTLVGAPDGSPALIGEATDDDILGTLSLRYVGGTPVLVSTGGTLVPARLPVVDGTGRLIGTYEMPDPQGAPAVARAGGHQVGLALELEQ
ncbi:hypothetical protein [Streptomyces sp. NPDC093093]|uniref:hypothetical protein n=1 Tax=Streptomyces sp. NPDC093093 TaxID=3366025 RepID=UPI0037FAA6CF